MTQTVGIVRRDGGTHAVQPWPDGMHPEALARWAALLRSSGGACVRRHIAHDTLYDDHLTTPAPASAFGPGVIPTSFLVNWPNWAASSVLFVVVSGTPELRASETVR